MPILTKQIYTINKIKQMEASIEEKIRLLKEIQLDPTSRHCTDCANKRASAQRLLNQMVGFEIAKLEGRV